MSDTFAVHSPRHRRLPIRLITIAAAVLLVVVTFVTIALFVAANGGSSEAPLTTVPTETRVQTTPDTACARFPVNTPC